MRNRESSYSPHQKVDLMAAVSEILTALPKMQGIRLGSRRWTAVVRSDFVKKRISRCRMFMQMVSRHTNEKCPS